VATILNQPPKYFRANRASGSSVRVDRKGGYDRAGVIRGVSVITVGEALGHGLWVDAKFLGQVAEQLNSRPKGIKSRFTHPGLSGDGLGRFVGRTMDAEVVGDQVIADLHFSSTGHKTPEGDLAGYLMDLAENDPEAFGLSIVFQYDMEATEDFLAANEIDGEFRSPDAGNAGNLPHARLAELRYADAVDEPAANPNGLFHRGQDIAQEADLVASYALGLSQERPETVALGLDADRVRGFVGRFLDRHNLTIQEKTMSEETTVADEAQAIQPVDEVNEQPSEQAPEAEATEGVAEIVQPEVEQPSEQPAEPVACGRFTDARFDAFGDLGGVWLAEGKSYAEAARLFAEQREETIAAQVAEIADLRKRLAAATAGESEPVGFVAEAKGDANPKPKGLVARIKMPGTN
jgi:hypothetical protein